MARSFEFAHEFTCLGIPYLCATPTASSQQLAIMVERQTQIGEHFNGIQKLKLSRVIDGDFGQGIQVDKSLPSGRRQTESEQSEDDCKVDFDFHQSPPFK